MSELTNCLARAALEEPRAVEPALAQSDPARRDHYIAMASLGVALTYATIRYNVFKHVPWADWPGYVVNKALALAGLALIGLSVLRMIRSGRTIRRFMVWAGGMTLAHVLLSVALLKTDYFAKLFADGKLTFLAGWSMLLGAGAYALLEIGARRSRQWDTAARLEVLALVALLTGLHAALPSVASWFQPAIWPGGLPPITLISFVIGAAVWALVHVRRQLV